MAAGGKTGWMSETEGSLSGWRREGKAEKVRVRPDHPGLAVHVKDSPFTEW